ncbi:MAG: hypothetical protein HC876_06595 [Chloroflexaceae bacterium]|nr:hypothetical protein [Chloroflexaceae bacterium]
MGLKERRIIYRIQTEQLPYRVERLKEISGVDIHYDIDWESMEAAGEELENFDYYVLNHITQAIDWLCSDPVGKQAVQQGIQKIVITTWTTRTRKKLH